MALRTIVVRFNTNVSTFTSDMGRASAQTERMTREFQKRERAMDRFNADLRRGIVNTKALEAAQRHAAAGMNAHKQAIQGFMASAGKMAIMMGGVVAYGLGKAVKEAAEFDKRMRDIQSVSLAVGPQDLAQPDFRMYQRMTDAGVDAQVALAEANENALKRTRETLIDMARSSEHSLDDLAGTMYEIAQAGFTGARAFEILHHASIAATAGQTDMVTASNALLTIMNAYGKSAPSVAEANDVLFQTVRVGIIRFEELAHTMGQFVGLAAVAGIRGEEWGAAIATFTRAGIPAAQAGTTLNRVITTLLRPSEQLATALKNAGIENVQTSLSTIGLSGVMKALYEDVQDNTAAWVQLFPQFRAARGALALVTDQGRLYKTVLEEFTNDQRLAGAAARAFAENQKSLSYQTNLLKNAMQTAGVELGTKLIPYVVKAVEFVRGLALVVGNWSDSMKSTISVVGALGAGVLILGGGFLALLPRIVSVRTAVLTLTQSTRIATLASFGLSAALGAIAIAATAFAVIQARGAMETQRNEDRVKSHMEAMKADERAIRDATAAEKERQQVFEGQNIRAVVRQEFVDDGLLTDMEALGVDISAAIDAGLGEARGRSKVRDDIVESLGLTDEQKSQYAKQMPDLVAAIDKALAGETGGIQAVNSELGRLNEMFFGVNGPDWGKQKRILDLLGDTWNSHKTAIENNRIATKNQNEEAARALRQAAATRIAAAQSTDITEAMTAAEEGAAEAAGWEADAIAALGASMENTDGSAKDLTESQKDLQKSIQSFVGIDSVFKEAMDRVKESMEGLPSGAETASRALDDAKEAARESAEASTRAENERLDDQNAAIDKRLRDQVDSIRDNAAKGSDAQRRAADERIDALTEAARKEKELNDDAKQRASDNANAAVDNIKLTSEMFLNSLKTRVEEAKAFQEDITAITANIGDRRTAAALVKTLRDMGEEGYALADDLAKSKDKTMEAVRGLAELEPEAERSFGSFSEVLKERVIAARKWQEQLFELTRAGYGSIARVLAAEGMEGAPLVEAALKQSMTDPGKKQLDELTSYYDTAATMAGDDYVKGLDAKLAALDEVVRRNGQASAAVLAESLKITPEQAAGVVASIEDQLKLLDPQLVLNLQLAIPEAGWEQQAGTANEPEDVARATAPTSTAPAARSTARVTHRADGGFTYFAKGSERHVAQIAKAGDWRVWAEPETGGEAYIPLSAQKRHRSVAILGQVAEQFGYGLMQAEDGVIRPPGTRFFSGGGMTGGSNRTVIQPVTVPMAKSTTYQFGDLTGPTMRDIQEYAERQARVAALTGVPVGA